MIFNILFSLKNNYILLKGLELFGAAISVTVYSGDIVSVMVYSGT